MIAVYVIVIYNTRGFILVFKLHTFPLSTHPSTVIRTNLFPTNCKTHSFDTPKCESNVYWTVHHCNSWRIKNQLDVTCYFYYLLCAPRVSDINISIIRSLRLCWWITTSVVLFSVRCVLELLLQLIFGGVRFAGWSLVIHQHSRRLLKMDILMSETCWAHKWKK